MAVQTGGGGFAAFIRDVLKVDAPANTTVEVLLECDALPRVVLLDEAGNASRCFVVPTNPGEFIMSVLSVLGLSGRPARRLYIEARPDHLAEWTVRVIVEDGKPLLDALASAEYRAI